MLLVRNDRIINVCEMKFTQTQFKMTADDEESIRRKLSVLQASDKSGYAFHPTLITTFGLAPNKHSGIFQNTITMDDLFSHA